MRGSTEQNWLAVITESIQFCEAKWHCVVAEPFQLSYTVGAPVHMPGNESAVLKLCLADDDVDSELGTLLHYQNAGACKVIDTVPDRRVMLLERIAPGDNLKSVGESEAIHAIT